MASEGSIRQRNLLAVELNKAFKHFEATTGVDLKTIARLEDGEIRLHADEAVALADAIAAAYDDPDDLPGDRPSILKGDVPVRILKAAGEMTEAKVITFPRRVPSS